GPPAAVVPAARVLRHVAADRSLIANLRRGDQLRRFGEQPELVADDRMVDDLRERRHRADLEAAAGVFDPDELFDLSEIDQVARAFQASVPRASTSIYAQSTVPARRGPLRSRPSTFQP